MTRPPDSSDPTRAEALLADRATVGLDADERAELEALGASDDESFELAAATLDLATLDLATLAPVALPAALEARLVAAAAGAMAGAMTGAPAGGAPTRPVTAARRRRPVLAWSLAAVGLAAAAAAMIWAGTRPAEVRIVEVGPPAAPSPAAGRAALLAERPDAAVLAWTATADPGGAGVTGDVAWSATAQRGYMRFVGLAPNDRARQQYQLWIFDRTRDDKFPVDGGVFDVSSTGEVIVPIAAKLDVRDVALFAVTIEPPGGVVVSRREHIVVTAKPTHG